MNANIETAIMSLIGDDPRFQRAIAWSESAVCSDVLL